MKKIITTIIFLYAGVVYGQSFEGTLVYVSDFELGGTFKQMGLTKDVLVNKMKQSGSYADTIKVSYKQGNYYSLLNNNPTSWAIYKADVNKIYALQDGDASDICTVTDASIDLESTMTGKMPTVQKLDTTVIIDGASCSVVRVKWNTGTYDYYYNPASLTIDASLFARHTYDGWAEFLKISNALPVRIVKITNGFGTATLSLVASKTEVIDAKLFTIPTLVPDKSLNVIKVANRQMMRIKK